MTATCPYTSHLTVVVCRLGGPCISCLIDYVEQERERRDMRARVAYWTDYYRRLLHA